MIDFKSYVLAIKKVFPSTKNNLCAWHVQQGFKKKFSFLNKGNDESKKKIYKRIIMLPLSDYKEDFEKDLEVILKSNCLDTEGKKYIEDKSHYKEKWVKAFMKEEFCSGMCTSSRIESMYRVIKRYLRSTSQLTELFQVFQDLEEEAIANYKDEIQRFQKKENKKLEKSDLIRYFSEFYSEYAISKLKDQLLESTNYRFIKKENRKW